MIALQKPISCGYDLGIYRLCNQNREISTQQFARMLSTHPYNNDEPIKVKIF